MDFDVIGASVEGEPIVYISAFIVLLLLAFARNWAESVVALVVVAGFTIAALLFGGGVLTFNLTESDKDLPSFSAVGEGGVPLNLAYAIGLATPALLGLAGAHLVLEGQAWSLLWVVIILLFVGYLKASGAFTIVVVLLLGAAIGWVAVQGSSELQAGVAVALVWLLLLGGISYLAFVKSGKVTTGSGDSKKTTSLAPGVLLLALVWPIAIIALWVGGRRLLDI